VASLALGPFIDPPVSQEISESIPAVEIAVDANRHWLNFGIGRRTDSMKWNFAYQHAFSDRDVSGSPFGLADGTYKSRFTGLMLNCECSSDLTTSTPQPAVVRVGALLCLLGGPAWCGISPDGDKCCNSGRFVWI